MRSNTRGWRFYSTSCLYYSLVRRRRSLEMSSPEQTVIDLMAESPDLEEKRRELDAEYPQYQGCRNKNGDDWDMRESDYL